MYLNIVHGSFFQVVSFDMCIRDYYACLLLIFIDHDTVGGEDDAIISSLNECRNEFKPFFFCFCLFVSVSFPHYDKDELFQPGWDSLLFASLKKYVINVFNE